MSRTDMSNCQMAIQMHYGNAKMSAIVSQVTGSRVFTQPVVQAQIKENIKVPRHWHLWGKFTGGRWILRTKDQ